MKFAADDASTCTGADAISPSTYASLGRHFSISSCSTASRSASENVVSNVSSSAMRFPPSLPLVFLSRHRYSQLQFWLMLNV